jgi:cytochrome b561
MHHTMVRQPAEAQGLRHDPTTIALHWITALLVAVLWLIGQTVDFPPNGPLRVDYRSLHITLGVALGIVLLLRLAWRLTRRETLPPVDEGLLHVIASVTHWALYVCC